MAALPNTGGALCSTPQHISNVRCGALAKQLIWFYQQPVQFSGV